MFPMYFSYTFSTGTLDAGKPRATMSARSGTLILVIRGSTLPEFLLFQKFEEKIPIKFFKYIYKKISEEILRNFWLRNFQRMDVKTHRKNLSEDIGHFKMRN